MEIELNPLRRVVDDIEKQRQVNMLIQYFSKLRASYYLHFVFVLY